MLTLLPHRDYEVTAAELLDSDLENAILHTKMLLECLHQTDDDQVRAWNAHPAADMWRGYEVQLALYGLALCGQKLRREPLWDSNLPDRIQWHFETATMPDDFKMEKPPWMLDDFKIREVERTHRSHLIKRNRDYKQAWPEVLAGMTPFQPSADEE